MLARLVSRPFDNEEWVFEVKWDGVRSFLFFDKAKALTKLQSRSGNEITHRYPKILESSRAAIAWPVCINTNWMIWLGLLNTA